MKNLVLFLAVLFCLASPAVADMLVQDVDPPNSDTNPQWLSNSGEATETAWLQGLVGSGTTLYLLSKDEDSNPLDEVPANWTYAILKFGVGRPSDSNPNHWAVWDNNNNDILDLSGLGLPTNGLSHVSYYGPSPVPEPATMILLGIGLIGMAGFGRRKFNK
jgi:hypothetical protein